MRISLLTAFLLGCTDAGSVDDDTTDFDDSPDDGTTSIVGCDKVDLFPTLSAHPDNSAYPDPELSASCDEDGGTLTVDSNGIPTFTFVPMTPNDLSDVEWSYEVPLYPEVADTPSDMPLLGLAGFSLTGLPFYGPNEGEFPDPYGDPVYNDIVDACKGHTAQRGDYHFHAFLQACITGTAPEDGVPSPIIGFAMDGFPIYGPNGCLDEDCTEVVTFESGWEQTGDPTTYAWDAHAYVGGSGDEILDECNGRVGPDGTYRYHATEGFPYIIGCYAGTATDAGTP